MKNLLLLKLIADLIKTNKPSVEEIRCTRTIIDNLIKEYDSSKESIESSNDLSLLDQGLSLEANQAIKDLM